MEYFDSDIDWKSINLLNLESLKLETLEFQEKYFKTFIPHSLQKSDFDEVPWQLIKKYLTLCRIGRETHKKTIQEASSELNSLAFNKSFNYMKKTFLENQLKNSKIKLNQLTEAITSSKSSFLSKKLEISSQNSNKFKSSQTPSLKICRKNRKIGKFSLQTRKLSPNLPGFYKEKIDQELEKERIALNQNLSLQSLEFLEIKQKIENLHKFEFKQKTGSNFVAGYEKIIESLTIEIKIKNQELKNIKLKTRSKELDELISKKKFAKAEHFSEISFIGIAGNEFTSSPDLSKIPFKNEEGSVKDEENTVSELIKINSQEPVSSTQNPETSSLSFKTVQPSGPLESFVTAPTFSLFPLTKPEARPLELEKSPKNKKDQIKKILRFLNPKQKFPLSGSLQLTPEILEFLETRKKKYKNDLAVFSNWPNYTLENFDWIIKEKIKKFQDSSYSKTFLELCKVLDSEFLSRKK